MKNADKESQKKQILAYLKAGKKITALDALHKFNCWRLSARICELRNEGHNIKTEHYETSSDKYVARYYLGKSLGYERLEK